METTFMKMTSLAAAYAMMGLFGFFLVRNDKAASRQGQHRVPERSLVTIGLLCGWPGVFIGMSQFRHKTHKTEFKLKIKLAAAANVILAFAFCILI